MYGAPRRGAESTTMAPKGQHRNGDHSVETTAFVYEQVGQVSKYTTVHMKLIIVRDFL